MTGGLGVPDLSFLCSHLVASTFQPHLPVTKSSLLYCQYYLRSLVSPFRELSLLLMTYSIQLLVRNFHQKWTSDSGKLSVVTEKQQVSGQGLHGIGHLQGKAELKTHLANKCPFIWLAWGTVFLPMPASFLKSFINTGEMDKGKKERMVWIKLTPFKLNVKIELTLLCFVSRDWGYGSGSLRVTLNWPKEGGGLAQALWASIVLGEARQGSARWLQWSFSRYLTLAYIHTWKSKLVSVSNKKQAEEIDK